MINISKAIVFEHFVIKFDDNNTKLPDTNYRAHLIRGVFQLMYKHQKIPIVKIRRL